MRFPLAGAILALGLALPSQALAVEVFATPDETKTAEDCLSEATACALGKALDVWDPESLTFPGPPTPPPGTQILTLLPGTYDKTDLTVPSGSFGRFDITLDRGAVLRGKPGAPRPTIAIGDTGVFDAAIDVTSGGTVTDLIVDATSFVGIEAEGRTALGGGTEIPTRIDRVKVISAPQPGKDTSFGLAVQEVVVATNVDIDHRSPKGAALSVSMSVPLATPSRLSGITATSQLATGAQISAGFDNDPGLLRLSITGSVLRGATDLDAENSFFSDPPPPGLPTPAEITLKNNAVRASSRKLAGPGLTFVESGTVDVADLGLGADRVPTASSPLVNAGIADPDLGTTDLLGNTRTVGPLPDIGAYEFAVAPPATPTPTPAPAASSGVTPTADRTGPLLAFLGKSATLKRSKLTKGKGAAISVSTSEAVTGGTLELLTRTKRKGKTTEKVLVSAKLGAAPAGTVNAQLKGKASKLGKGKLKAFLRITLTDAAGNATTTERAVTIK